MSESELDKEGLYHIVGDDGDEDDGDGEDDDDDHHTPLFSLN